MKRILIRTMALAALLVGGLSANADFATEPVSTRFTVSVDHQDVPVYTARVLAIAQVSPEIRTEGEAGFASFDAAKSVSVTVTCLEPVQQAKILPTSRGITPVIQGKSVTFVVSQPGQLTLEVNGDWNNSLHLFANPVETDIPDARDPNVIYFGPGIHQVEAVKVGSGKTVYLAPGAIVYGKPDAQNHGGPVFALDGDNITLRGRGIIDASALPKPCPDGNIISAHGRNIRVEGVVLRDSPSWTFPLFNAEQVKIENIKIFGCRGNSDGIDIDGSRNIEISDCFMRTFDDLVVVKSQGKGGGGSHDILVRHCVLWNEIAHALSLGAELRQPVHNVTFSDCDIIHDKGREWLLRVYNCDSAPVRNIVFDHIRIEEARRPFSLWIGKAIWSQEDERGHIDDVTFSNITSVVPESHDPAAMLVGFDAAHAIHQVIFDHVTLGGRPLAQADISQNAFVDGVVIQPPPGP